MFWFWWKSDSALVETEIKQNRFHLFCEKSLYAAFCLLFGKNKQNPKTLMWPTSPQKAEENNNF